MPLRSKLLAHVRHGFSTRLDGDMMEAENRRRFAEVLGVPDIVTVSQVHGTDVVQPGTKEGDGLVSVDPAVGVRTADCAPVLIATEDGRRVAAVHAGWRGACAGILRGAIEQLGTEVLVAIGPTIGLEAFEVGPEVIEAARESLDGDTPPMMMKARPHLDLVGLLERQLDKLGISAARVERVGGCTFEDEASFFSYRRERGVTGRHLSAIAPNR